MRELIIESPNSQYSTIVAGTRNIIHNSGTNPLYYGGGFIGAGSGNTLGTSLFHTIGSSILGGASNSIGSDAGTVQYAAIVNGRANIIGHNYSAIIGGQGLASNASHTTFMNGLDSDTDSVGGTRPLKYHGGYANEGLGRILTSDALGNASWQDPGFIEGLTGDCVVATAYTVNCILFMVTSCTGTTAPNRLLVGDHIAYTADTCHTFGGTSPYEYGSGVMATGAIQPILGNNQANVWFSHISGGENNAIHYGSYDASIGGGWGHMMDCSNPICNCKRTTKYN